MKKPAKAFMKAFVSILLVFAIITAGLLSGAMLGYFGVSDGFDYETIKMSLSSAVYALDPETNEYVEYEQISGTQNRIWVDIDQIPEEMQQAAVAIEDERFYQHHGVDIKRTLGAFLGWITGKSSYGGSTITQQLIKNVSGETQATPSRKIIEMWRALNMEARYSKEQILELYLNTIYLGQGANGVQTAARTYFSRDVWELNLAECASIIGITQYPSEYDPFLNEEKNKEKQETILYKMCELGMITEEERDEAIAYPLEFKKENLNKTTVINSYFTDNVIEEVIDALVKEKGYTRDSATTYLYSGGLKIYATVDPTVQSAIEKVYTNQANFPSSSGQTKPQAAMVILDPYTGAVKGLVGGRGEKTVNRPLNYATQTIRQPGSTIKPIGVYAPALENNTISPNTAIDDKPRTYGDWTPKNNYRPDKGILTVRKALQYSSNTIAVAVLNQLGVTKSFDFLTNNLGITSLVDKETIDGQDYTDKNYSALALGGMTKGVSVIEMAAAYQPFVNYGTYSKPYSFTKVTDRTGRVVLETTQKSNKAMSEENAFIICDMLTSVVTSGTGRGAALANGTEVAGKTGTSGTSEDDFDRWFIGCTPYYVGACWFGYSTPQSLNWLGTNPNISLWKKVMDEVHKDLDVKEFETPSGVKQVQICSVTGKKPGASCPTAYEYITSGSNIKGTCDGRHSGTISDDPIDQVPATQDPATATPPPTGTNVTGDPVLPPPEEETPVTPTPNVTVEPPSTPNVEVTTPSPPPSGNFEVVE